MGDIHDDLREVMGLIAGLRQVAISDDVYAYCRQAGKVERECYGFLEKHGPALLAAAKYEEANPLGGPATMLEAAARRIRAGEDFHEVLADYGLLSHQEGEDAERYRWLHD